MSNDACSETQLDKWVKRSQAFALSFGTIAVAVIAASAQISAGQNALRKDYLGLAVDVLKQPPRPDNDELRDWGAKMVERYSPVPFSPKASQQLRDSAGGLAKVPMVQNAMAPREACPKIQLDRLPPDQRDQIRALQDTCGRNALDLFWLQIFVGLLHPTAKPPASGASVPGG